MPEHLVDERIRRLFGRQMDGQPERSRMALDLTLRRAGVRRLHQAWSAAGDDVDPHPSQLVAELLHFFVDGIATLDAGTAEDRDAIMLDPLGLDLIEVVDG